MHDRWQPAAGNVAGATRESDDDRVISVHLLFGLQFSDCHLDDRIASSSNSLSSPSLILMLRVSVSSLPLGYGTAKADLPQWFSAFATYNIVCSDLGF